MDIRSYFSIYFVSPSYDHFTFRVWYAFFNLQNQSWFLKMLNLYSLSSGIYVNLVKVSINSYLRTLELWRMRRHKLLYIWGDRPLDISVRSMHYYRWKAAPFILSNEEVAFPLLRDPLVDDKMIYNMCSLQLDEKLK